MSLKQLAKKFTKGAVTKQLYLYETWLRLAGRSIQLVFAATVIGLYGTKVHADHKAGTPQSVQWVYAVIIASLSALTAVLFAIPIPSVRTARLFAWDLVLGILYISVFGIFAVIFLRKRDGEYHDGARVSTMRHAVWIDLVNAVFWFLTGAYGCFRTFVARKIDGKLDELEAKVTDKVGGKLGEFEAKVTDKVGGKLGESAVGAKIGAAAMPFVAPKLNKFAGSHVV